MAATPTLQDPCASMITLLTRQRDLYRELKTLSEQQAALIDQGDTDRLLSLLAQRQRIVDTLAAINRELVPLRQASEPLPGDQRVTLNSMMDEVDALLTQIIEQDERDRQLLQAAQHGVGAQVRQMRQGSVAASAYRSTPQAAPRFTDRQG